MLTLKEAYIGLQAELENARQELSQAQQSVAPLIQATAESEKDRQAVLVEARRYKRCLDTDVGKKYVHAAEARLK